jgi:hypothetical protein
MKTKTCPCGKSFAPQRSTRIYCSNACKQRAHINRKAARRRPLNPDSNRKRSKRHTPSSVGRMAQSARQYGIREDLIPKVLPELGAQLVAMGGIVPIDSAWQETKEEKLTRIRGQNIALAVALCNVMTRDPYVECKDGVWGANMRHPRNLAALRHEYYNIVGDPRTIAQGIDRRGYQRARYSRERDLERAEHEERLATDLKDWLKDEQRHKIEMEFAASSVVPDHAEEVIESLDGQALYEEMFAQLTPAEKQGLEAILNGESAADEADKKRRQRARRKLKKYIIEQGEPTMSSVAPTVVERLSRLERKAAEYDRQLGLVDDEIATQAVDQLLESVEDESE